MLCAILSLITKSKNGRTISMILLLVSTYIVGIRLPIIGVRVY